MDIIISIFLLPGALLPHSVVLTGVVCRRTFTGARHLGQKDSLVTLLYEWCVNDPVPKEQTNKQTYQHINSALTSWYFLWWQSSCGVSLLWHMRVSSGSPQWNETTSYMADSPSLGPRRRFSRQPSEIPYSNQITGKCSSEVAVTPFSVTRLPPPWKAPLPVMWERSSCPPTPVRLCLTCITWSSQRRSDSMEPQASGTLSHWHVFMSRLLWMCKPDITLSLLKETVVIFKK